MLKKKTTRQQQCLDTMHTTESFSITDTKVFSANIEGEPVIQHIVNIFQDKSATVKVFMPRHPGETSTDWLRVKFGAKALEMEKRIHTYIAKKGATLCYIGN